MSVSHLPRGAERPDALRPLVFPQDLDVRIPEFWAEDRDGWPFWAVSVDVEALDLDAFDDDGNLLGGEEAPTSDDMIGLLLDATHFQGQTDDHATDRNEVAS